ncbi:hypothetical protein, partial [Halomonas sp. 707D7]|uniref:hypothetical protein n=1 Tax=Halomonas sp. 707D7 TaxID=1681044 RepID=UPI00209CD726
MREAQALAAHAQRLARRRWRQLVWLRGEPDAGRSAALSLWRAAKPHQLAPAPPRQALRVGGERLGLAHRR